MFKRVLIASDLSHVSDAIIGCMDNLKTLEIKEVVLFYALGFKEKDEVSEIVRQQIKPDLERQQELLKKEGFNVTLELANGIPSEEIKRICKEKNISIVVLGSHGSSAFTHQLFRLGGVASEILNSHEKPLLFLRIKGDESGFQAATGNLKEKILFATDFSDISMYAFEYLEELVKDGAKNITLMHVQDKGRISGHLDHKLEEFNHIDNERLMLRKERLERLGATNIEIKIPFGIPAQEIINEAHQGYSLIVMGSQGRGYFANVFIGSVSYKVARNSDVSVLLVPEKFRELN
ncbi:universal stress protein [Natronoflexus pectinivorans]|uniref:Nucleotide-binding universal stress UspA family protein n=1 Tax=Natronoflexus pectinivorans TaxID=682526 RepID=A0A4V2RWH0_9BACT|nr:universal stress protein [Natronoflexus pectinivorans]TCO08386.1 nucleotide-binding universal stress UspA family protein [Natronoflexus pectinivorans]